MSEFCQWMVYDREQQQFALVTASDWRGAVLKAADRDGIIPRMNWDVRPRTADFEVADRESFRVFMGKHF